MALRFNYGERFSFSSEKQCGPKKAKYSNYVERQEVEPGDTKDLEAKSKKPLF